MCFWRCKTKGRQRKLKASFLKILHAFMYDPFYEFFDLISVFGYMKLLATLLPYLTLWAHWNWWSLHSFRMWMNYNVWNRYWYWYWVKVYLDWSGRLNVYWDFPIDTLPSLHHRLTFLFSKCISFFRQTGIR